MKRHILLLTLCSLTTVVNCWSQNRLTLSEAIARGMKNNYDVLIGEQQVETAVVNNSWGAAGAYPTISLGASANLTRTMPEKSNADNYNTITLQPNADLSWTLFGGFKMWRTKAKLDASEELSRGTQTVLLENTVSNIIAAYYSAVLEERKIGISKQLMEVSYDRYLREQKASQIGVIKNLDLLQAKNAWLQDKANYMSQQTNFDNALRQLNYMIAEENAISWTLADSIPNIVERFELPTLRTMVESNNSSIRNQYVSSRIKAEETMIAQSDYYPTLTMNGGSNYSMNRTSGVTNSQIQPYVGAKLSFNIFTGNKRQRTVRIAKINQEIEHLTIQDMKLSLRYELDKLYDAYTLRQELVELYNEQLKASELSLRIAEQKYVGGTITQFDFRDVQISYYNAAINLLTAKYNLVVAHMDILKITGMILK